MTTTNSNAFKLIRRTAWILIAVLAVFLAASWYLSPTSEPIATEPKPYASGFELTNQDGKTVTEKDFLGKPTAWFYGFTHCPDICPTALAEMAQVLKELGPDAEKLTVVFVSVDPARDTPAMLKDYVAYFDPRIVALTGSDVRLRAMTKARYVFYKKLGDGEAYDMEHTAGVQLATADGRFFGTLDSHEPAETRLQKIRRLIAK